MTKKIPLTQGKVALVDDADYEWLMQWKWCVQRGRHTLYAARRENYKHILMHREIMQAPTGVEVDHRDGSGLNNQRQNLRRCTSAENRHNGKRPSTNKTGYKGVSRYWKKYQAHIKINGKSTYLGLFATAEDAARAYDEKAKEAYGEFARTNF